MRVRGSTLKVDCGLENAIFDITLYGPGGSSRCIKFGEHMITPIEFEALAGKKNKNWKFNIRSDGKPLKTFFESQTLKTCEKTCNCENCETGKKFPTDLELLIEKVYMIKPFDLRKIKVEKEDKDVAKEKTPKRKHSKGKGQEKVNGEAKEENVEEKELNGEEKDVNVHENEVNAKDPVMPDNSNTENDIPEKETTGKDLNSVDGAAPLNDVKDEFCTSPDPSPRKKRSSIETPVDEILQGKESELKQTRASNRTRKASQKLESSSLNTLTAPDFDLNKEVAPLVNMPEEKIITDEMAPIKQETDIIKKKQQKDIRSFFSPPAKESKKTSTGQTSPTPANSPAKSDCSVELVGETEPIKKVLEVDLTESPNKSLNTSLGNSPPITPEPSSTDVSAKKPRQILKRSPPSITKETLVRHTRGMRLQDRTEVVKQKHQQQREESVGKDKKAGENEPTRSGRSSRQSSTISDSQVNGEVQSSLTEARRPRRNDRRNRSLDQTSDDPKQSEKNKDSIKKRNSTEDDELLKILKQEKSLCLSPRKRVLREANKVDGEDDIQVIAVTKSIQPQRRAKRKLSEHQITVELEKGSPVVEKNKKEEQEPPNKRQRRLTKVDNSENSITKDPEVELVATVTRRQSKEEKENSNANANPLSTNGVIENREAASKTVRKGSKEEQLQSNSNNALKKVPVTTKSSTEPVTKDSSIDKIEIKELNEKKELKVVEPEISKTASNKVELSSAETNVLPVLEGITVTVLKDEVNKVEPKQKNVVPILKEEVKKVEPKQKNVVPILKEEVKKVEPKQKNVVPIIKEEVKKVEPKQKNVVPIIKEEVKKVEPKQKIVVPILKEEVKEEVEEIKPIMNGTTVKTEFNDNKISPNKLPTYTTMIKSALEEMNVTGGEGCSKLEILLYILRKFRPKGNVNTITTKLIKILEVGTKRGDFLSSVSCPRVLKQAPEVRKEVKERDKKKKEKVTNKDKIKKIKTKDGKVLKVKASKLTKKVKQDKDKKEKKKRVVVQSPQKIKEPLSIICKAKRLTRHEVLKKIWAYIHAKKLQDPTDKTIIICDENFKKLTKCKQISQSSLMSYIKPFMEPIR
eukprot:GFUD01012014.1.p1 GENE.GFUD01012014.1~~GFUD01012014.1.p1  ORF type:complete len:1088 (-),score=342.73 GFUD01012014.1:789-4052(-)